MIKLNDILILSYPTLDLHGLTSGEALIELRGFIDEQKALGKKKIVVIHGIGKGIIKKVVRKELRISKKIENFNSHIFNEGITIITLK